MTETLWAVIIGGAIGVIGGVTATIPPLIVNHYRWKKEKKLEHLRAERRHLAEQYMQILSKLAGVVKGHVDWNTIARMCITLPEDLYIKLWSLLQSDKSNASGVVDICSESTTSMRESLDEIDKQINKLLT